MASIKSKKNKMAARKRAASYTREKREKSKAIVSTRTVSTTRKMTDEELIKKARNSKYKSRINDNIKANSKKNYMDYNFLFIMFFLICFGLIMLYSTSYYTGLNKFNDPMFYMKKQLRSIILGFILMFFVAKMNYKSLRKWAFPLFCISTFLCLLVHVPKIGIERNGSKRWIGFGSFTIQPSEIAKVCVIIWMAYFLERTAKEAKDLVYIMKALIPLAIVSVELTSSNLSTAIIVVGIAMIMIFVVIKRVKPYFEACGLLLILGIVGIKLQSYRGGRIRAWLSPEKAAGPVGEQTLQGLYAICSGGFLGKGLGKSMQKMGRLPEAQNDMIFSIICEELGIFGAICLLLLFVLLIWRMMIIANNAPDMFGTLIVVGVMAHISLQVVLNVAVVTKMIPNTGVTLPFVSYGGTSIIILIAEMGLVLSVSRGIKF
ncbi:putative lipid II flippase FtsW [Lachnobacterium bovis]|uniref:putative lipid II flippase FtsW n=1 Tax=Lachnobacterium bovis TaxID=140626 RepID=UPI000AE2380F|nr:putative lipid II flippase FtsW [Lachnobacterium bovis]